MYLHRGYSTATLLIDQQNASFSESWASMFQDRYIELGGAAVTGIELLQNYDQFGNQPDFQDFIKEYRDIFNQVPGYSSILAYEAAMIILQTLKGQKKMNPSKTIYCITAPFRGFSSPYSSMNSERAEEILSGIELNLKTILQAGGVMDEREIGQLLNTMINSQTPIGNILTIATSMQDEEERFSRQLKNGITKKDLEEFLQMNKTGMLIVEKNISRVTELVSSFKKVSSDQTSSVRREFQLKKIIDDTLTPLAPLLNKHPGIIVETHINDLTLNSYPGPISQVLTNLVTNPLFHAWDEGESGILTVSAERLPEE